MIRRLLTRAHALDARLLAAPRSMRAAAAAMTLAVMVWVSLPNVPRAYADLSTLPLAGDRQRYETHGTDTIGAMYAARVILNDVGDMYTFRKVEQTPLEQATWSTEASAPYPPATLLAVAGLSALGAATGLEYYGMVLVLAAIFVGLSLCYFSRTRWYLFPLLYLNFFYFAHRFVYVQDGTYLVMLVVVMAALVAARRVPNVSHLLMALAITTKLSPIAYVKHLRSMTPPTAAIFAAILLAGLVLPFVVWDNYSYIYTFHETLKGNVYDTIAAIVLVVPFTLLLWYVDARLPFDAEDRIGWALVPFAMFVGIKMRVARHLLIVLLVPDKRGPRNIVAAVGLALHAVAPGLFRLGSVLYISTVLLFVALVYYLDRIGWPTVRDDVRHPMRTVRMILAGR
jgi:hypothetical protein